MHFVSLIALQSESCPALEPWFVIFGVDHFELLLFGDNYPGTPIYVAIFNLLIAEIFQDIGKTWFEILPR